MWECVWCVSFIYFALRTRNLEMANTFFCQERGGRKIGRVPFHQYVRSRYPPPPTLYQKIVSVWVFMLFFYAKSKHFYYESLINRARGGKIICKGS